jgi:hypothetical protein
MGPPPSHAASNERYLGHLVACNRGFDTAATVDASRLAASLVGQILPVFSLLGSLPSGRLDGLAGIDLPVTGH